MGIKSDSSMSSSHGIQTTCQRKAKLKIKVEIITKASTQLQSARWLLTQQPEPRVLSLSSVKSVGEADAGKVSDLKEDTYQRVVSQKS